MFVNGIYIIIYHDIGEKYIVALVDNKNNFLFRKIETFILVTFHDKKHRFLIPVYVV